jgi:hypothetical protein
VKLFKSSEEKHHTAAAEEAFRGIVADLATADPATAKDLVARISQDGLATLDKRARRKLGEQAFVQYANNALADDHLTADEEDALMGIADAIGLDQEDFNRHALNKRLQIAMLNDGRMPGVETPSLMPKRGEVVHLEPRAQLLKEVAVREWRGGSSGVSFRVAKGVRYRVGSTRGHMVTVGTQLQVADEGVFSVTSQRVAFLGNKKTVDMPYSKILGMRLYSDAIGFSLSNRQTAPLFKVGMDTDVLAALLNAAMQASQA